MAQDWAASPPAGANGLWRTLWPGRGAPRLGKRHGAARRLDRDVTDPLVLGGRQRGRRVEDEAQPGEVPGGELGVAFQRREEVTVTGGHVEVDRRLDGGQVRDRGGEK